MDYQKFIKKIIHLDRLFQPSVHQLTTYPNLPLVGKTDSFVKNSRDFAELVKIEKLESDEIMVSFDVKSLFTNVPVTKALDIIHQKLEQDQTLDERTPLSPSQLIVLLKNMLDHNIFPLC